MDEIAIALRLASHTGAL